MRKSIFLFYIASCKWIPEIYICLDFFYWKLTLKSNICHNCSALIWINHDMCTTNKKLNLKSILHDCNSYNKKIHKIKKQVFVIG